MWMEFASWLCWSNTKVKDWSLSKPLPLSKSLKVKVVNSAIQHNYFNIIPLQEMYVKCLTKHVLFRGKNELVKKLSFVKSLSDVMKFTSTILEEWYLFLLSEKNWRWHILLPRDISWSRIVPHPVEISLTYHDRIWHWNNFPEEGPHTPYNIIANDDKILFSH